ncbi:MAG TPA: hypothetical protein ENI92_02970 [Bacteroidetes bacterium]|nr:hypothetical protein [Bacteroidota bacterium]
MHIGIIGTGRIGGTLGRRLAELGEEVFFGSRKPAKAASIAAEVGHAARGGSYEEAAGFGEVVMLATPWNVTLDLVRELAGELAGRVLVDITNPIAPGGTLALGHRTSAAEEIAAAAPEAKVVKAFNAVYFEVIADPAFPGGRPLLTVAGDDPEARGTVIELGGRLGFEAVDAGPLRNARLLEPLAMLWIQLAFNLGQGTDTAFGWLRR